VCLGDILEQLALADQVTDGHQLYAERLEIVGTFAYKP
jgi:hypothetical protein